ncbi:hypothetical protein V5F44_10060 [Xanthobacter sp. V2C-8]|uniref:hypothetical protein n=1 Tax=Xanthobacter albus TaxID=3119929 RepID=UPI00372B8CB3
MGEINISRDEQDAIKAIDARELDKLIDKAIQNEQSGDLHRLSLTCCGTYVSTKLHHFDQALARHRLAKSARKREETGDALRRAGRELSFAFSAMKQRMETEQVEAELFRVDDQIMPPYRFTKQMSVRVGYRWRRTIEDEWQWGSITFVHHHDPRPDYTPAPKRKPSAAKQEQELQDRLYQTWEHLMRGALYSVRDYFRDGGDGATIPETFQVTVDSYSRGLNNYSTQFWRQQP